MGARGMWRGSVCAVCVCVCVCTCGVYRVRARSLFVGGLICAWVNTFFPVCLCLCRCRCLCLCVCVGVCVCVCGLCAPVFCVWLEMCMGTRPFQNGLCMCLCVRAHTHTCVRACMHAVGRRISKTQNHQSMRCTIECFLLLQNALPYNRMCSLVNTDEHYQESSQYQTKPQPLNPKT